MTRSSTIELTLIFTPAGRPAFLFAISWSMASMMPLRMPSGATSSRR